MRRRDVILAFERLDSLPQLCVRHGTPATMTLRKTFRTPRRGVFLLRPWWFLSLLYRGRKRVSLPVCRRCFVYHQLARLVFWPSLVWFAVMVITADPSSAQPPGGAWTAADYETAAVAAGVVLGGMRLWYRPVDGERSGERVRLIKVAAPFAAAATDPTRAMLTEGGSDPRFTWPVPSADISS